LFLGPKYLPGWRKRLPARAKQQLMQPKTPNQVWIMDFIHNSLWDGRTVRLLNNFNRLHLALNKKATDDLLPFKQYAQG
jgi:putative transposase